MPIITKLFLMLLFWLGPFGGKASSPCLMSTEILPNVWWVMAAQSSSGLISGLMVFLILLFLDFSLMQKTSCSQFKTSLVGR
jgi:hypothetical protein